MNVFHLSILEADKPFYVGECESLIVPTTEGQYGVQAHHRNMIAAVVAGTLKYRTPGGEDQLAAVSNGMIRIENNDVLVLVESAERPEDIDINRAQAAAARAKEAILQKKTIQEYRLAQDKMARELNRLRVKNRYQ